MHNNPKVTVQCQQMTRNINQEENQSNRKSANKRQFQEKENENIFLTTKKQQTCVLLTVQAKQWL